MIQKMYNPIEADVGLISALSCNQPTLYPPTQDVHSTLNYFLTGQDYLKDLLKDPVGFNKRSRLVRDPLGGSSAVSRVP